MASTYASRIQGVASSVAIKAPVRAATTANIALAGLQTIDGVVLATGDRVLVKDQTTGKDNGIYTAGTGNWTRAIDFDGVRDAVRGTQVYVTDGTANGLLTFSLETADPEVGSSALSFASAMNGAASAAIAEAAAAQAALYDGPKFDTLQELLADTALTYTTGQPSTVAEGDFVRVIDGDMVFGILSSSATAWDVRNDNATPVKMALRRHSAQAAATSGVSGALNGIALNLLKRSAARTFVGNPSNSDAENIAMTAAKAAEALGFLFERSSENWSLDIPTGGTTLVLKGGRIAIDASTTTIDVLFDKPFPNARLNIPVLTAHTEAAPINVASADTGPTGGGDETEGFPITLWEWDSGTNDWVTITTQTRVSWLACGY